MKCSHRIFVAISLLLFLLLAPYGCSTKPPDEEIKLAQQAMDEAKSMQADKLAALDFSNAMQTWNNAQSQIKQNRMGDARTFYLRAKSRFEKATEIAKAKRNDLMKEIDEARTAIGSNYGKVKTMMASSRVPAKLKKDAETSCAEIDKGIAEIEKAISDGDVIKAKLTSKDINEKVYQTARMLETGGKKSQ